MRIEYEGLVEQQPTYSHVGYVSVASIRMNSEPAGQVGLGIAALGIALALKAYARRGSNLRRSTAMAVGIIGVLMLVGGGIVAATNGGITEKYYPSPYHETFGRLIVTDRGLQEAMEGSGEFPAEPHPALDAWWRPFRYIRDPGPDFGHPYNIVSAGADGEFGTIDDIDLSFTRAEARECDRAMDRDQPWPERPDPAVYWEVRLENAR